MLAKNSMSAVHCNFWPRCTDLWWVTRLLLKVNCWSHSEHWRYFAHMYRFMMPYKVTFQSCLIFTLCTFKLLSHMNRFMMPNKLTFPNCQIFALWTLKMSATMNCLFMQIEMSFLEDLKSTYLTGVFATIDWRHRRHLATALDIQGLIIEVLTFWKLEF